MFAVLEGEMETASEKMHLLVSDFDFGQMAILTRAKSAQERVEEVSNWAKSLVELNLELNRVIDTLAPLIRTMREIAKALKQTIRVPVASWPRICYTNWYAPYTCGWNTQYVSFTINRILDDVSKLARPVVDLLERAVDAVLNPLLTALNLNIALPEIPGLSVLHLPDFDPLQERLEELLRQMQVLTDFRIEAEFNLDLNNGLCARCHE